AGEEHEHKLYEVTDMVEKPKPVEDPTNLAIIGRYVLTNDIFEILRHAAHGQNGEIQVTDALCHMAKQGKVLALKFKGLRFDCGSVEGYVEATNHVYKNIYSKL